MIRATLPKLNKVYAVWLPLLPAGRWRRYNRRFIAVGYGFGELGLSHVIFTEPKTS